MCQTWDIIAKQVRETLLHLPHLFGMNLSKHGQHYVLAINTRSDEIERMKENGNVLRNSDL